jgi:lipid-binding SYLF domain-containing protein
MNHPRSGVQSVDFPAFCASARSGFSGWKIVHCKLVLHCNFLPVCFYLSNEKTVVMMKRVHLMRALLIALAAVTMFFGTARAGWDPADEANAERTIEKFRKADPSLERFFERAYGYAVFSDIYKGGIMIVGGGHGKGVVYDQGRPIGHSTVTMLNVGPQLGGQSFSEIIFFKDHAALADFTKGNYELSAQFAVVAVKAGMATNTDYSNGVAVFAMPNAGLMGELTVGGQKFSFNPER